MDREEFLKELSGVSPTYTKSSMEWVKKDALDRVTNFSIVPTDNEVHFCLNHLGNIKENGYSTYSKYSLDYLKAIINKYFKD